MILSEKLLLALSKPTNQPTEPVHKTVTSLVGALELLNRVYPQLADLVAGKRILDFGCGSGLQSIALAKFHRCRVTGLDTNADTLDLARANVRTHDVDPSQVTFTSEVPLDQRGQFDVVIAKDSFEHFDDPEDALRNMAELVADDGVVLVTFGPPWLSPYGSHMHFFCKVPWLNILFSERTVMRVRSNYRDDGATRYQDVASGLNKMTIARFESSIAACSLTATECTYDCVRSMNWLGRIPGLRELFINHVTVVLHKNPTVAEL